jgi:glyoxylase-like metal-dependent hydrolase (beta-lactamase superfamily II)
MDQRARHGAPGKGLEVAGNRVHILSNGLWHAPGPVIYRHPSGRTEPVAIAMNYFLVEAGDRRILVDTGIDNLDRFISDDLRAKLGLGGTGSTRSELERLGLRPEDVDTVVLTHLHFDHCENLAAFTNARIILNELEWRFVTTPQTGPALTRAAFPRAPLAYLIDEAWERFEVVNGTAEVAPGVNAIWTGGHTPGHQIVTVTTDGGLVILTGDEIATYDNLDLDIPIGGYHDLDRVVASMRLIRSLAGVVVPAHEPLVAERHPDGVIPSLG